MINFIMAKNKGLSSSAIVTIDLLHERRRELIEGLSFSSKIEMAHTGLLLAHIEVELQRLWGFEEDVSMTKFWNLPYCTCPKIDNHDRMGTGFSIFNEKCPLHTRCIEGK